MITRRDFLKVSGLAAAGGLLGLSSFTKLRNEANDPVIDRVEIPIRGLHPGLEGFTIVQIADIHLHPFTHLDVVEKAIDLANSLQPDLTVLVGDYIWRDVESIFMLAPALARLNAKHGVYWIIGNHDIWEGADIVKAGFASAGIPLLLNQGVPISSGKGTLFLAGLDDGWSGHADLDLALENAPKDAPVIMLLHEPDLADQYAEDGRVALQLAGHSHAGQVRIPGYGAIILPYLGRKYDMGLYKVQDMWLYTNRGLGVISVPYRINCPPEVTQIVLVQA